MTIRTKTLACFSVFFSIVYCLSAIVYCGTAAPLLTPRGAELFPIKNAPAGSTLLPIAPPDEDTNSIFALPLGWDDPNSWAREYELGYGPAPKFYTNLVATGNPNTSYLFCKTNWLEESDRHFYAVRRVSVLGEVSEWSNEIFFPFYPADRIDISWPGTNIQQIQSSRDKRTWSVVTNSASPVTIMISEDYKFFRTYGPPPSPALFTRQYNPLNP